MRWGGEFGGMKILFLLIALLMGSGLGSAAEPIRVASLSTVMADLARDIGGERVEVVEILKPGMDPHIFEPSPGDYKTISNSRILLASGLGFEGYLDKLRPVLEKSGVRLVVGGEVVEPIEGGCEGHDHSEDHGHHHHGTSDPHWWQSVSNVQLVAAQIRDALIAVDPEGRGSYEKNAAKLDARLEDLGKWVRMQVVQLPKKNRVLVTSHDALGYFAKDYGFEILPVQGISTSEQPSSQKVRDLIGRIRERGVKAIFAESIENPKVLGQITSETGAKPGGVIYADGLGSGETGTYEGMMRHNVTTIVEALK